MAAYFFKYFYKVKKFFLLFKIEKIGTCGASRRAIKKTVLFQADITPSVLIKLLYKKRKTILNTVNHCREKYS